MNLLISVLTHLFVICAITAVLILFQLHEYIGDGFTILVAVLIWASFAKHIS